MWDYYCEITDELLIRYSAIITHGKKNWGTSATYKLQESLNSGKKYYTTSPLTVVYLQI
jgi:hypothetical protein